MNVFVLSAGHCGSTTFARACEHLTNFTAAHETRSHLTGADRLAYPDHHIESDNRLAWLLGRLGSTYGDRAYYVHLVRDREAVVDSFAERWKKMGYSSDSLMGAYRDKILMCTYADRSELQEPVVYCRDYVDTVTVNIQYFLRDRPNAMTIELESVDSDFPKFLEWIGAQGDLNSALLEWRVRHNKTGKDWTPRPTLLKQLGNGARRAYRSVWP